MVSLSGCQLKLQIIFSILTTAVIQFACMEYLTQRDKRNFETCVSRARVQYSQLLNLNDTDFFFPLGKCHFMNGTNWAAVALVSFPGSGNTWVRGLLEQATGVCTGRSVCLES